MIRAFALELLCLFYFPRNATVPILWPLLLARPATTSARCSQTSCLVRILPHLVPFRRVSYVLFDASSLMSLRPVFSPSYASPLGPSLTQAPPPVPMLPMAKLIMHRHVLIALFHFDLPTWLTQYCASLIGFRPIPITR